MKGLLKQYNSYVENRRIIVDILAILFGVGSWIGVNGMFVQLPLLVKTAPEEWILPSHMSIAVQIANIGPISYGLFRKFGSKRLNDAYWIYPLLFIGFISAILTAFLYDHHTIIGGEPRSTAFLCLVFLTALVGCSSSVLFYPYMRHFKELYLISYFIGEGLSGFIPSILALIQGVGGNPPCQEIVDPDGNVTLVPTSPEPLFSTTVFFSIISFVCLISFGAFILLVHLNICKNERVPLLISGDEMPKSVEYKMKPVDDDNLAKSIDNESVISDSSFVKAKPQIRPISLLVLMSVVCAFGNGIFPSIQSYSCLPYGNLAYHLAVTLGSMANPIACFLAIFLPRTSSRSISILTSVCAVFIAYVLTTSVLSPTPPLVNTDGGVAIIVISWIGAIGLVSYIKLCISTVFRTLGESWMFYCGAFSQLGSAVGSLLSFGLVNYTNIFVQAPYCAS